MKIQEIYNQRLCLIILLVLIIIFLGNLPTINFSFAKATEDEPSFAKDMADKNKTPSEIIYIVKPGDSVAKIACKYKVHRYQIRQWNNIDTSNAIRPGQELVIKQVDYPAYEGLASWYGPGFHGQNMANGQVYDMNKIIVAHRTLPLGRKVCVTNLDNGRSIVAPVLDRGPYVKNNQGEYTREIDLSYVVALELGTIKKGVVPVKIEPIDESLIKE